ncbi:MAG: PilZ domain-containing protein [Myxococcaceae bacterium]
MTSPATAEKRLFPRLAVTLTAHCRIGNRYVRDPVGDLSLGGLFLRTRERAKEGTPVRVALALPSQHGPRYCTLVGNVARIEREGTIFRGLGVSFSGEQIGAADRLALERFFSQAA